MLMKYKEENPVNTQRYSNQSRLPVAFTDDPVQQSIQDRIHQLTGLPIPMLRTSEELQVVNYIPGGHYDCHMDSEPTYLPNQVSPCCHLTVGTDQNTPDCSACRYVYA